MADKLEVIVDADNEAKTVILTLKFPEKEMKFHGNLESLRTLATSNLEAFKTMLSAGGIQDLKSDLYRIYTQVKAEFDGEDTGLQDG